MVTALVARLTGPRLRQHLAMTSEITLRGLVLPIGAIKEKVPAETAVEPAPAAARKEARVGA